MKIPKKVLHYYNNYANIKVPFKNNKKGINKMGNITKTTIKKSSNKNKKQSILGILQLFAVASIAYSTIVIVLGTEGVVPLILVTPQALLAICIAINKFSK